jgi:hypothetical protein
MYAMVAVAAVVVVAGVLAVTGFRGGTPESPAEVSSPAPEAVATPSPAEPPTPPAAVDAGASAGPGANATPTDAAAAASSSTPAARPGAASAVTGASRGTASAPAPLASSPIPADAHVVPPTPAAAAATLAPLIFSAQTVVVEGGRNRQRDSIVRVADGAVTVTGRDNTVITTVPFDALVGLAYSNSKQPLWNSPQGPAEIAHLDGGAFGFLRGDQHWVSLRTEGMSLVLRVRDQDSRRVVAGIEERTGRQVEIVTDRK